MLFQLDEFELDEKFELKTPAYPSDMIRMVILGDEKLNIWQRPLNDRIALLRTAVGLCRRLKSVHSPKEVVNEEPKEDGEEEEEEAKKLLAAKRTRRNFLAQLACTGNAAGEVYALSLQNVQTVVAKRGSILYSSYYTVICVFHLCKS